ncbi:MAG TPA: glycosyltransferase [Candidatus Saccharimonadales bacterium]|nr:glycosyltransferase [Candidatus Saccharimonadales bacterium]
MTIVVTGGGSGGHITPILAVADELKKLKPDARVVFIGQYGDSYRDVVAADPHIDEVFTVRAGKFRRYHGEGWRQLYDVATQLKNARDAILVLVGIWQSYWLLRKIRPDVIFTRGGFVSVPVALGGHLARIPYITHDSDSIPSLANRIIARWAAMHAVALPPEVYAYPPEHTVNVGVPVSNNYVPVNARLMEHYRTLLHVQQYEQVLFITGGGNGAQNLNKIMIDNVPYLLKRYPHLVVLHIAGSALEAETNEAYDAVLAKKERARVRVEGFVKDLYRFSGAADVIVARGGATNLAEFAIQGKACLLIPSPQLLWNVKNAQVLVNRGAVMQLTEEQAEQELRVATVLTTLLDNPMTRDKLAAELSTFAHPGSARELAMLLLDIHTKTIDNKAHGLQT